MPASLGSLAIHFRHMTEGPGGMEPGQVSRVTSHVVLSPLELSIARGWAG